jgi:hypothetical protein
MRRGVNNMVREHGNAKLTNADILLIRELHKKNKWTQVRIGKLFNLAQSYVSLILTRKIWRDI